MFSFLFILPLIGSVKSEAYPRKLEPDEENKLLQEMKNGSREARGKLIEHNLRLVAHIAKNMIMHPRIKMIFFQLEL